MGLDDIETKTVEVVTTPDGSRRLEIGYMEKFTQTTLVQASPDHARDTSTWSLQDQVKKAWSHNTVRAITIGFICALIVNIAMTVVRS